MRTLESAGCIESVDQANGRVQRARTFEGVLAIGLDQVSMPLATLRAVCDLNYVEVDEIRDRRHKMARQLAIALHGGR